MKNYFILFKFLKFCYKIKIVKIKKFINLNMIDLACVFTTGGVLLF